MPRTVNLAQQFAGGKKVGREDEIVAIRGRLFDIVAVGRPVKDLALPSPITPRGSTLGYRASDACRIARTAQ